MSLLQTYPDADLIRELATRKYRAIHRDQLRTVTAMSAHMKYHRQQMSEADFNRYIRNDIARNMAAHLADHFPIEELPAEHHVDYRMTFMVIGPKVSADDPYYLPPLRAFE